MTGGVRNFWKRYKKPSLFPTSFAIYGLYECIREKKTIEIDVKRENRRQEVMESYVSFRSGRSRPVKKYKTKSSSAGKSGSLCLVSHVLGTV